MKTVTDQPVKGQPAYEQNAPSGFVQLQLNGELVAVNYLANKYPLDKKILGGIAIFGRIGDQQIAEVSNKLSSAFTHLEQDKSREFGECIAYGIDVHCEDEILLDNALVQAAVERNHGMLTKESNVNSLQLWEGHNGNANFKLTKYVGNILLNNYEMPTGLIYSLVGAKKV